MAVSGKNDMEGRGRAVLAVVLLLVIATMAALAVDMAVWGGRKSEDIRLFQRATGGIGMGAIATPMWQFLNYDARVLSVDDSITWPVPGGYSYGPDRTGTVSYFQETPEDQWVIHRP